MECCNNHCFTLLSEAESGSALLPGTGHFGCCFLQNQLWPPLFAFGAKSQQVQATAVCFYSISDRSVSCSRTDKLQTSLHLALVTHLLLRHTGDTFGGYMKSYATYSWPNLVTNLAFFLFQQVFSEWTVISEVISGLVRVGGPWGGVHVFVFIEHRWKFCTFGY